MNLSEMGHPLTWSRAPLVARVREARADGRTYPIRLIDGRYTCTCTTFAFHDVCSHTRQIAALGLTTPITESH